MSAVETDFLACGAETTGAEAEDGAGGGAGGEAGAEGAGETGVGQTRLAALRQRRWQCRAKTWAQRGRPAALSAVVTPTDVQVERWRRSLPDVAEAILALPGAHASVATQKLILLTLAIMQKGPRSWIALADLRKATGLTKKTFIAQFVALEAKGWLHIERLPGYAHRYTLTLPSPGVPACLEVAGEEEKTGRDEDRP